MRSCCQLFGMRAVFLTLSPTATCLRDVIVPGGGAGFVDAAWKVMAEHLKIVPAPELRLTSLGRDTTLIGAITAALESPA